MKDIKKCGLWAIVLLGSLVTFSISMRSSADDTDIYLNQNGSPEDKPMLMFSLDYRSSLGNTVCSDDEYDEFGDPANDTACASLVRDGYLAETAIRDSGNYSSLEVFRALLKNLMEYDIGTGIKIKDSALFGLMMNHANSTNCDGPNEDDCSNGGYMVSKFRDLSIATDYTFFFDALENIPIPNLTWNQVRGGNNQCKDYGSNTGEHQYQGAELFFEFFRYLTGQKVHNGHTGYKDFGTDNVDNMDENNSFLAAPYSDAYPYYGDPGLPTCRLSPTWDASAEDAAGVNYISPLLDLNPSGCGAEIYTLNFMFQVSNQDEGSNCAILADRVNGGMDGIEGNPNNCNINSSGNAGTFGKVLEFFRDADLAVDTDSYGTVPDIPGDQGG